VVVLDDLDRFLSAGLGAADVRQLSADGVVLATLSASHYQYLQSATTVWPEMWQTLQEFTLIEVDTEFSAAETALLRKSPYAECGYDESSDSFAARICGAGVAWRYFLDGQLTCPAGWALARAAVDWRRATGARCVNMPVLEALLDDYLLDGPDASGVKAGLAWATASDPERPPLLRRSDAGPWIVDDFVFERTLQLDEPIRDRVWDAIESDPRLSPVETLSAAIAASQQSTDRALRLLQRAAASSDDAVAPSAALLLGKLREDHGDGEGAAENYLQVIQSGHPTHEPAAALALGTLRQQWDDIDGALVMYQVAIDSGNPSQRSLAALLLGNVLEQGEHTSEAVAAYQLALDCADQHYVRRRAQERLMQISSEGLNLNNFDDT
jgi:tetratricopeptide (TPR) repeat protein